MKNKYYNEAIIGNKNIVASYTSKGELLRLYYPTRDYKQFVEEMYTGVKINDGALIYLHDDINNQYHQYYEENTNILNTQIKNTYFNLEINQIDFVSMDKDILIKKYIFKNENTINLDVNFLVYSNLLSNSNNMIGSRVEDNILMQYTHDYTYNIFSKHPILSYKLNDSKEQMKSGILYDKDYIGMAKDSAISYNIGTIAPGEIKELELYIYINDNSKKYKETEILKDINKIRAIDIEKELSNTKKYWLKYVKEHDGLEILSNPEKWSEILKYDTKKILDIQKIYIRSILLFPLLSNTKTGGVSAAIEADENRDYCGRYSYCWPRDAVFITKALDIVNMKEETTKFYTEFAKNTQSKTGMWEQRFYTDERVAPAWGYQIDETASIVYGVYEHYKEIKDIEFLKQTKKMCEKAVEFLKKYVDYITENNTFEDKYRFEKQESYDLWEMHEGIHTYSLSAIYGAFTAMQNIEKQLDKKNKEKSESELELEQYKEKVKSYTLEKLCKVESKTLKRNNKDDIVDISTLGAVTPFEMLDINGKEVQNTIEIIELTLRTYTGGYIRFENDNYLGGNNPWPIATLWMGQYFIKQGNIESAKKTLDFVTKTATKHGLLAEQIDNHTMKSKWVIGLGWSHAMYIITLCQLLPFGDVS